MDPKIWVSSKFPGNADAAGPGTTLWELLSYGLTNVMNDNGYGVEKAPG